MITKLSTIWSTLWNITDSDTKRMRRSSELISKIIQNTETISIEEHIHIFDQKDLYAILDLPKLKKASFTLNEIESDLPNDISPYGPIKKIWTILHPFLESYCHGSNQTNHRTFDNVHFEFNIQLNHSKYKTSLNNGNVYFSYDYTDDNNILYTYGRGVLIDLEVTPVTVHHLPNDWSDPDTDIINQIIQFISDNMDRHINKSIYDVFPHLQKDDEKISDIFLVIV